MHVVRGEITQHKTKGIKLMAVVHRLHQIMINENLMPDELVGCASVVRDNYRKFNDISNPKLDVIQPPLRRP